MHVKYQEDINRATGIYPYQIPIGYRPSEFEIFEPPDSKSTTDKQIADKKFAEAFRAAVATSDETTASSWMKFIDAKIDDIRLCFSKNSKNFTVESWILGAQDKKYGRVSAMFGPWNIWRPDRLSSLFNETDEDQVASARGPMKEDGMLFQKSSCWPQMHATCIIFSFQINLKINFLNGQGSLRLLTRLRGLATPSKCRNQPKPLHKLSARSRKETQFCRIWVERLRAATAWRPRTAVKIPDWISISDWAVGPPILGRRKNDFASDSAPFHSATVNANN
jgi:hypothetical protein